MVAGMTEAAAAELARVRRRLIVAILKDWTCRNCGWLHLGAWRATACGCCGFGIRYSVERNRAGGLIPPAQ